MPSAVGKWATSLPDLESMTIISGGMRVPMNRRDVVSSKSRPPRLWRLTGQVASSCRLFGSTNLQLIREGNEDKKRCPRLFQEQFRGMGANLDVADVLVVLRADDPDFSVVLSCVLAAIAHVNKLGVRLVDDAVGSRLELDRIEKLQSVAAKHSDHSVVAAFQK